MEIVDRIMGKHKIERLEADLESAHIALNAANVRNTRLSKEVEELKKRSTDFYAVHSKINDIQMALAESQTAHVITKQQMQRAHEGHQAKLMFDAGVLRKEHDGEVAELQLKIDEHKDLAAANAREAESLRADLETSDGHLAATELALTSLQEQHYALRDEYAALQEANCENLRLATERLAALAEQKEIIAHLHEDAAALEASVAKAKENLDIAESVKLTIIDQLRGAREKADALTFERDEARLQRDAALLSRAEDFIKITELERGLHTPIENELIDKLAALTEEHNHCLKYGGETAQALLKHRNKLIAETNSKPYLEYKASRGIK